MSKPTEKSIEYRIHIKERLHRKWSTWFEDTAISYENGETMLTSHVTDLAALYGLLIRLRDLNLTLLSVERSTGEGRGEIKPNDQLGKANSGINE